MDNSKQTSLEWKKLKPVEGDKHHWQATLFPLEVVFDIYEVEGKYKAKMTWDEYTKDISWFATLEAAQKASEVHMNKSFSAILDWINK